MFVEVLLRFLAALMGDVNKDSNAHQLITAVNALLEEALEDAMQERVPVDSPVNLMVIAVLHVPETSLLMEHVVMELAVVEPLVELVIFVVCEKIQKLFI